MLISITFIFADASVKAPVRTDMYRLKHNELGRSEITLLIDQVPHVRAILFVDSRKWNQYVRTDGYRMLIQRLQELGLVGDPMIGTHAERH